MSSLCILCVQAVLARYGIPEASFGPVCVIVDKMEKIPRAKVGGPWGLGLRVVGCTADCSGCWLLAAGCR